MQKNDKKEASLLSWYDAIMERRSIRNYKKEKVPEDVIKELMDLGDTLLKEEFSFKVSKENEIRLKYVDNFTFKQDSHRDATQFIAIIAPANCSREYLMECGYILEKIILQATRMGVGTCWIGGRFLTIEFQEMFNEKKEEGFEFETGKHMVVCVTPLGYKGKKKRGIADLIMKKSRYSDKNLFFEDTTQKPLDIKTLDENHKKLFNAFKWAPSAVNMQKWKIIKEKGKEIYHFITNPSSTFYTNIDIGIGVMHWEIMTKELGIKGKFKKIENKDISKYKKFKYAGIGDMVFKFGIGKAEDKVKEWNQFKKKTGECIYFVSWIGENEKIEEEKK